MILLLGLGHGELEEGAGSFGMLVVRKGVGEAFSFSADESGFANEDEGDFAIGVVFQEVEEVGVLDADTTCLLAAGDVEAAQENTVVDVGGLLPSGRFAPGFFVRRGDAVDREGVD